MLVCKNTFNRLKETQRMSDLTITAASVVPSDANTVIGRGTAGATIVAGQPFYLDANTLLHPANANVSGQIIQAAAVGVAVNSASTGQPVEYASAGDVTMTVTAPAGYLKPG